MNDLMNGGGSGRLALKSSEFFIGFAVVQCLQASRCVKWHERVKRRKKATN